MSALGMHGTRHRVPACNMGAAVYARSGEVALPAVAGLRALGNDQAHTGALGVIRGRQGAGRAIELGTRTGRRRHDKAVGEGVASDTDGAEQLAHRAFGLGCVHVEEPVMSREPIREMKKTLRDGMNAKADQGQWKLARDDPCGTSWPRPPWPWPGALHRDVLAELAQPIGHCQAEQSAAMTITSLEDMYAFGAGHRDVADADCRPWVTRPRNQRPCPMPSR